MLNNNRCFKFILQSRFYKCFYKCFFTLLFLLNIFFLIIGVMSKKYYFGIGVLLFLFCFKFFFRLPKNKSFQSFDTISLLSYNVTAFNSDNDVNDSDISSKILNVINTTNTDILVLQESFYRESRKIKGYPYKFLGYRKENKKSLLAIYSKYPILNTGYIDFPNTLNAAIYADIKIHKDTVRIYNIHLQSFGIKLDSVKEYNPEFTGFFDKINNSLFKQIEQAKMVKKEATNCNNKVIICGDFNSTQFSLPYRILKIGLNDSFISKGNGLGTTYALFHYPLRLDFFLLDPRLEIINHENFDLNLSDHEPIMMKFKI